MHPSIDSVSHNLQLPSGRHWKNARLFSVIELIDGGSWRVIYKQPSRKGHFLVYLLDASAIDMGEELQEP